MIRRISSRRRPGRNRHLSVPLVMVMVADAVARVAALDLLREGGYAVREVDSLEEAIWRTDLEPPDAIVMDVPADWRSARIAARSFRIQRATHDTPVIALAAGAPPTPAEHEGIDAVLVRPYSGRELLQRVDEHLDRRGRIGGAA